MDFVLNFTVNNTVNSMKSSVHGKNPPKEIRKNARIHMVNQEGNSLDLMVEITQLVREQITYGKESLRSRVFKKPMDKISPTLVNGSVLMRVYAPYWIINHSLQPLLFSCSGNSPPIGRSTSIKTRSSDRGMKLKS